MDRVSWHQTGGVHNATGILTTGGVTGISGSHAPDGGGGITQTGRIFFNTPGNRQTPAALAECWLGCPQPVKTAGRAPLTEESMPHTKLSFLLWLIAIRFGLSFSYVSAQTPAPPPLPARHQVKVWGDADGLPQNSVFAVARTPDGYMWLGTVEGLVRFDGVRFTVFDAGNTPEIGNSHVTCLLVDHAGSLWIGTAGGGLARYQNRKFVAYTTRQGLSEDYLTCLCEGPDGTVWAGTFNHGLNQWKDGHWSVVKVAELVGTTIGSLAVEPAGNLWVGTAKGAFRLQDNAFTTYALSEGKADNNVRSLCFDHTGTLWIGTTLGLRRFDGSRFVPVDLGSTRQQAPVQTIHETPDGTLWIGHGSEVLVRGATGLFAPCAVQGELPRNVVSTIRGDPEGNVWVGTDGGGLVRLRHGRFGAYTTRDGLSGNFVRAVRQDGTGGVWVRTSNGVDRWENGRFVRASPVDAPPVAAIAQDHQGSLWIATNDEARRVCRLDADRLVPIITGQLPPIHLLMFDRAGDLWVGTEQGLLRFSPTGAVHSWEKGNHPPGGYIVSLFEDRSGAVWVGTVRDGVYRYQSGEFTQWTTAHGLSSNHVLSFYEDKTGTFWIGTHGGGLNRFTGEKFATVTTKNGLYDNLAFVILEDDVGELWMSGNKGVYRASLQELNACADGRSKWLNSFAYGVADGMPSRECNGGAPAGWKMSDGTLWFATIDGLAVVNPARRNVQPPSPAIEMVMVDHVPRAAERVTHLESSQTDLEIQYTALSWHRPEAMRFQYRLAGLDRGWNDAGTRRAAYFSHLPPGRYAFQVRADNGDGVWSEVAARLSVVVSPPFWRTWWFFVLVAGTLAAAVSGALCWRGEQLRRRYALQQEFSRRLIAAHETERRRIAAELHDGLGQTLAMIKNSAVFGTRNARDLTAAQAQMEQITQQSAQAIGEVREIAYNLRPYLLDRLGLTKALRSMLNKVADHSALTVTAEIDELQGCFSSEAEMSIYRIVQESVGNVIKHAEAREILMRIEVYDDGAALMIRDDGKGFDAAAAQGEARGFGLMGIAERVRLLGGTYTVQSELGTGTKISIHIPLDHNAR